MMAISKKFKFRHSGEGRNPAVLYKNAVMSVRCTALVFCWTPAFAGVTNF
jgi:hypothetical protein